MVRRPRTGFLIAAAVAAIAGAYALRQGEEPLLAPGASDGLAGRERAALPRIGLDRIDSRAEGAETAPARDIFQFGRAQAAEPAAAPATAPAPPAALAPPSPFTPNSAAPAAVTPFAVRYVGTVERQGLRVAVLLSEDRKEILTGREGDTVANRLRIVKIGFESVDVQDVGSDRVRRIPLRGN